MRQYPEDDDDRKDLARLNAEPWMVEALKLNPEYVHWGPHEDYMWKKGDGWDSPVLHETWKDFGPWELDEMNEIVHFYFELNRAGKSCEKCGGSGYHPDAHWVERSWYRHCSPFTMPTEREMQAAAVMAQFRSEPPAELHGRGAFPDEETLGKYKPEFRKFCEEMRDGDGEWSDKLVQEEVVALVKEGRLMDWTHDLTEKKGWQEKKGGALAHVPTAAEVNAAQHKGGFSGHDSINQMIAVKARCERFGMPVLCHGCEGHSYVYTAPKGTLGVVFWVLHPRKGASRGVEVKEIRKDELKKVLAFLKKAAERNAKRFQKVLKACRNGNGL